MVIARIVLVDHTARAIRLSLRPHVLEMRAVSLLPALGDTLSNLAVVNVLKHQGVLLSDNSASSDSNEGATIPIAGGEEDEEGASNKKKKTKKLSEEARQREVDGAKSGVYIHRSALFMTEVSPDGVTSSRLVGRDSRLELLFKAGAEVGPVRIKGYYLVEGWTVGSNSETFLSQAVIHSSQIRVGMPIHPFLHCILKVSSR